MEALLCEQGGHPSLYAGKMGGPVKDNNGRRGFICHDHHQVLQKHLYFSVSTYEVQGEVFTWTSAASPGPAPSRSEAFRFSSWKTKFGDSVFPPAKYFSWDGKAWHLTKDDAAAHLFQKVPGFLREVRRKAEFAFQDFVDRLLTVFTSEGGLRKISR